MIFRRSFSGKRQRLVASICRWCTVFGGDRLSRHPVAHQQTQRTPPLRIMPQGTDDCAGQLYNSRRPSIAFCIVTSSAYSMSLPTGTPVAMRVTFTLALLSSFDR